MDEAKGRSRRRVVLAAVDYGEESGLALESAADLARADPKTELHVVHVLKPAYPIKHDHVDTSYLPQELEKAGEYAKIDLPKFYAESIRELGSRVIGHVCFGTPDREIMLLAGEIGAELIVMGTHGRTRLERVVLGGVAERVLCEAPCAVLVLRAKQRPREPLLESRCSECAKLQEISHGAQLWCARHSPHRTRMHAHTLRPASSGREAMTFRFSDR